MIKIPRGNDFATSINMSAVSLEGMPSDGFSLSHAESIALRLVGTHKRHEPKSVVVTGNVVTAHWSGHIQCGVYGIEITGTYQNLDFRYAEKEAITIVETSAEADNPPATIVTPYELSLTGQLTLYGYIPTIVRVRAEDFDPDNTDPDTYYEIY